MRIIQMIVIVISLFGPPISLANANYAERSEVQVMVKRLAAKGLNPNEILTLMSEAKRLDSVINAMNRPAERKKWKDYRSIFLKRPRILAAKSFHQKHRETLARAELELGVPVEVILAIIGVETYFGKNKGSFRALDALATLGLDYPKRAKFFLGELESLFLLAREENLSVTDLKGSYAGAMGFGQFIPSSYLAYAIDFDNDGRRDLINNPADAIGSVANYLMRHGWDTAYGVASIVSDAAFNVKKMESAIVIKETGSELTAKGVKGIPPEWAQLPLDVLGLHGTEGDEYWAVTKNFYVITRYNRSPLYAMAVTQLSEEIAKELAL
ncbi:MAG: lytic murein transglycosylase B [Gammaproteobacteria bacterium]|nr:lytic murein transglycosylase B [Gammaproteobacteria bacterium]|tara:strand:- start:3920 stop:4897 length:978 start_codon:yes stop_codon:yes gene_type:complete